MTRMGVGGTVTLRFIYLLAVLGLHCCTRAFSSCSELGGCSPVGVCRLLIAGASVAEHSFKAHGLQELWLPGSGVQAQ